jgi:hypothetical protein
MCTETPCYPAVSCNTWHGVGNGRADTVNRLQTIPAAESSSREKRLYTVFFQSSLRLITYASSPLDLSKAISSFT